MNEYYVTYYRAIYPPECKDTSSCREAIVEQQKVKECFSTSCGNCEGGGPNCNWGRCHYDPYICVNDDCPELKFKADCRISIGMLTSNEFDAFKELTGIKNRPQYVMHYAPDWSDSPTQKQIVEMVRHKELIQNYHDYLSADPFYSPLPDEIDFLEFLKSKADSIRAVRQNGRQDAVPTEWTTGTPIHVSALPEDTQRPTSAATGEDSLPMPPAGIETPTEPIPDEEPTPSQGDGTGNNKELVPANEASKRLGVTLETLSRYRTAGKKPNGGRFGVDSKGNKWRYVDRAGGPTEYLLPRIPTPDSENPTLD